ncbi:MAG: hypothetical protein KC912_02625 [Proteobacteria bacterium]|nr:hypothetical protein [Pseudomonadota bacterium]
MNGLFVLLLATALATVELSEPPVDGLETLVTITDDRGNPVHGATVRVIHRAGLADSAEMAIGISDAEGQVPWVPAQSGTAELIAGDQTLPVQVAWTTIPTGPASALLMVVIAAVLSLGYGLRPRS